MKRRPLILITCCDHCSATAAWLLRDGRKGCGVHHHLIDVREDDTVRSVVLLEWAPSLASWPS